MLAMNCFGVSVTNMKLAATRRYTQTTRALSAEATAQHIVDAFLERLMKQWFDEITLDLVAQDAGVTVQTVVRRFGGKEGLLASAVKTMGAQINGRRANPRGNVENAVDKLIEDYEQTGDAVVRLLALEPRHAALKEVLDFGRSEHRRWVSAAFEESLGALNEERRQCALDALIVVTDVYTWKLLRSDMKRSVESTAKAMRFLIEGTITQFSKPNSKESKP
jgi:AcrR family transcriptional regulator